MSHPCSWDTGAAHGRRNNLIAAVGRGPEAAAADGVETLDELLRAIDRCVHDRRPSSWVLFAQIWDHAGLAAAYGAQVAEEVVRHAGGVLRDNARPTDMVGRIGEAELAVLMPELPEADLARLRRRLVRRLGASVPTSRGRLRVSVEVGAARLSGTERSSSPTRILESA